jgi:hypothetical protein
MWGLLFPGLSLPLRLKTKTRFVFVRALTHHLGRGTLLLLIILDFNTPLSAS